MLMLLLPYFSYDHSIEIARRIHTETHKDWKLVLLTSMVKVRKVLHYRNYERKMDELFYNWFVAIDE